MARLRTRLPAAILLLASSLLPGCKGLSAGSGLTQKLQTASAVSAQLGSLTGALAGKTSPNPLTPTSLPGLGTTPGSLAGPGTLAAAPQTPFVPSGQGSDLLAQLQQRYRIQITGNGVNAENLQALAQGIRFYQPQHTQGLVTVQILEKGRPKGQYIPGNPNSDKSGYWHGDGVVAYGYTNNKVHAHTFCHEVGHHVTLKARTDFGGRFLQALMAGGNPYATSYARTNEKELMAEALSALLLGPGGLKWSVQAGFQPGAARGLVQQEFGAVAM